MQQLICKNVLPTPLKDKENVQKSEWWRQYVIIDKSKYYFAQAVSGTGKTTLIHCLYGLRKDYEGHILWDNVDINTLNAHDISKYRQNDLSIIFQDLRLFENLTAFENLALKQALNPLVTNEEMIEWMNLLGIKDKLHAKVATMSYGEQQRLAIIRALLQPFSILLMDEPFSHLDHLNKQKAAQLILKVVQKNNAALLLVDLDANNYFPYHKTIML